MAKPRKHPQDDPLRTTKHRVSTLQMLASINDEIKEQLGVQSREDWTRDDTLVRMAIMSGFAHLVPAKPGRQDRAHE